MRNMMLVAVVAVVLTAEGLVFAATEESQEAFVKMLRNLPVLDQEQKAQVVRVLVSHKKGNTRLSRPSVSPTGRQFFYRVAILTPEGKMGERIRLVIVTSLMSIFPSNRASKNRLFCAEAGRRLAR